MEQTSSQVKNPLHTGRLVLGNIVVTGGLGFIGSHFVRHILARNIEENLYDFNSLVNIDFCGYGSNEQNLKDIQGNAKYRHFCADINDLELLRPIFQNDKVDLVVNFAAETHVDRSIASPEDFIHSNVDGVISLLELCRRYDVKKFVQISTDEVYGDAYGQGQIHEGNSLEPNSPYSASKASADLLVRAYNKTYGINTNVTRCSNNFGPNQFPEKLVPKTIIRALKGLPIPIYGDGKQTREWIYVQDHVNAISKVISEGGPGQIYNISSSEEISNIELVKRIIEMLNEIGSPTEIEVVHVPDRPAHDRRYSMDSSKIRDELEWKPKFSFHEALQQTISWYLKNRLWWEPLVTEDLLSEQPWKLNWNSAGKN